jgi:hypothetical protein
MNAEATRLLKKARTEAELMNDRHVGVEHVFLAAISGEGEFIKVAGGEVGRFSASFT